MPDLHHSWPSRARAVSDTNGVNSDRKVLALAQAPEAIELRHLRAFVAVAEDLSFSKAAQRLFITQPALSRQIRGLERLVGCALFRRSTQRVELTLAGESLLARARALLADLDDAVTAARSAGGELASRMALLWEPWARASASGADWDHIRAAIEELHGGFAPPPGVTVTPVVASGCRPCGSRLTSHPMAWCCMCTAAGTSLGRRSGTATSLAPSLSPPARARWSWTTGWRPSTRTPPPCRT